MHIPLQEQLYISTVICIYKSFTITIYSATTPLTQYIISLSIIYPPRLSHSFILFYITFKCSDECVG